MMLAKNVFSRRSAITTRATLGLESLDHEVQQVVGQRARERLLGQDAADRLGLARADPDRQDALAVDLAQDDDVLLGLVLEDQPVDADLDDVHGLPVLPDFGLCGADAAPALPPLAAVADPRHAR